MFCALSETPCGQKSNHSLQLLPPGPVQTLSMLKRPHLFLKDACQAIMRRPHFCLCSISSCSGNRLSIKSQLPFHCRHGPSRPVESLHQCYGHQEQLALLVICPMTSVVMLEQLVLEEHHNLGLFGVPVLWHQPWAVSLLQSPTLQCTNLIFSIIF